MIRNTLDAFENDQIGVHFFSQRAVVVPMISIQLCPSNSNSIVLAIENLVAYEPSSGSVRENVWIRTILYTFLNKFRQAIRFG